MSLRPVKDVIQTKPTIEGPGVKLQRTQPQQKLVMRTKGYRRKR